MCRMCQNVPKICVFRTDKPTGGAPGKASAMPDPVSKSCPARDTALQHGHKLAPDGSGGDVFGVGQGEEESLKKSPELRWRLAIGVSQKARHLNYDAKRRHYAASYVIEPSPGCGGHRLRRFALRPIMSDASGTVLIGTSRSLLPAGGTGSAIRHAQPSSRHWRRTSPTHKRPHARPGRTGFCSPSCLMPSVHGDGGSHQRIRETNGPVEAWSRCPGRPSLRL